MVELEVETAPLSTPLYTSSSRSFGGSFGGSFGSQNGSTLPTAHYQIEEPVAVAEFLRRHPFLPDLLSEARQQISAIFGTETPVELSLFDDPEWQGNPELCAQILTRLSAEEGLALQDRFDQSWWIDNLDRAQGKFVIMVGFV